MVLLIWLHNHLSAFFLYGRLTLPKDKIWLFNPFTPKGFPIDN